ncbi:hypothetical protein Bca52824_054851 [Brassica carinata]|uniref:Uncharacterized protein n=1 Tax=Brassica carinata TaxID=52824 RepID=A0A8X7R8E2_BRACI|nr:hypothetical protein Bca52824_054851 [Brassica carinata]
MCPNTETRVLTRTSHLPPEPARRHDGAPSTAKTNPRRLFNQNSLRESSSRKVKSCWIYETDEGNLTAYNRSLSSGLLACGTNIFEDKTKLEDASTQPNEGGEGRNHQRFRSR